MEYNNNNDSAVNVNYSDSMDRPSTENSEPGAKPSRKKFDITEHGGLLFVVIIIGALFLLGLEQLIRGGGGLMRSAYRSSVETKKKLEEEKEDEKKGTENPDLLGLAKTLAQADESIRNEIEEIEKEKGLPDQVFQRTIPSNENVGALITKEFSNFNPQSYQNLRDCISTSGPWSVDMDQLQRQSSVLSEYQPQRNRLRELLDQPNAQFEQDMVGTEDGLVPDDHNIDSSWSYMTLEECEVARCLKEGDMDGAVESLRYMLRFTELASQTQFAVMRIHAAYMRENTLRILQTLAIDPNFTPKHADTVLRILRQTLKDWPSDAKCWIGERADGLRRFNQIRNGRISDALDGEEQDELKGLDVLGMAIPKDKKRSKKESNLLDRVAFYKPKSSDIDEDYYLKAMRTLIASCSQPFYARLKTLNQVADNLQSQQGKPDYPALSMLMLRGIREQMQTQAMDKTRVEAWYLALATSLHFSVKEGAVDPVRGKPYIITRAKLPEGNRIIVVYGSDNQKVEVKE